MTLQRFIGTSFLICASTAASAQLSPRFTGELWADLHYEDSASDQSMGFEMRRALLGVETELLPQWSTKFSLIGATNDDFYVNDAYLQYLSPASFDLRLQFGRVKLPYFDFVEQSFSHRWAELGTQAEFRNFQRYRDEGVRADFAATENLRLALMLRNGAENQVTGSVEDADLGWNATLAWRSSPSIQAQVMIDQQTRSEPLGVPALTTVLASMGLKGATSSGLLEINYQNSSPGNNVVATDKMGFALYGQYSFDGTLDSATDKGLLLSLLTGSKNYKEAAKESYRVTVGGYRKFSNSLRSAVQIFAYEGVNSTPGSGGAIVYWLWEAKF
jgi:hypothetical protein